MFRVIYVALRSITLTVTVFAHAYLFVYYITKYRHTHVIVKY